MATWSLMLISVEMDQKKALYGLKQAPRAWNSRIDKYFQDNGLSVANMNFKKVISCEFEMTDIRLMSYYLRL
ncbi:hypothetical protein CR513_06416, partial [Mucuna pruriens]